MAAISSLDGGATWQSSSESLAARGFASLAASGNTLVTFGGKVYWFSNGGKAWTGCPGLNHTCPHHVIPGERR